MLLKVFERFVRHSEQSVAFPYTPFRDWSCVPQVQSIYCMVCTKSLYKTDKFHIERANPLLTNTILKIRSVMLTQKMYHISNIQYSEVWAHVLLIFYLSITIWYSLINECSYSSVYITKDIKYDNNASTMACCQLHVTAKTGKEQEQGSI
jgi:hypothetical protein